MPSFMYFFLAAGALIVGYAVYSRVIEACFGANEKYVTPAKAMADGVDFVVMPTWKVFLIQLLNIAGVGPVFGPILGALYGPAALFWIVLGSIFAGGVHDYFSGMLSCRSCGDSVPDIVGENLGNFFKQFMRVFAIILLLLVGVVFVTAPAGILANLVDRLIPSLNAKQLTVVFVGIIFFYYFLATLLPIDKIIGRFYPFFAVVLIFMAVGVLGGLIFKGYEFYPTLELPETAQQYLTDLPLWPVMFITIACGALSGFHATQSPMMARCLDNEKHGRGIFYGAMVAEGLIALIWATAGMIAFYDPTSFNLSADILMNPAKINPGQVVTEVSFSLLGLTGGALAIVGVVILPITSGDTAFRAARLTIADIFRVNQRAYSSRIMIALPLFAVGIALTFIDFGVIWRYFGFANQGLATVVLWAGAAYLVRKGSKMHWVASIPATFMTAVCAAYICLAQIGFSLDPTLSQYIGVGAGALALLAFLAAGRRFRANPVEAFTPCGERI